MSVVLDIETCASPDAAEFLGEIKAPANYKDAEKIEAYKTDKLAELVSKAALEPDLCEIVAVGFSLDGGQTIAGKSRGKYEEAELLRYAWDAMGSRDVLGFNVIGFDLPVLIRRSQLLGLRAPNVVLDRYRTPHIDIMQKLTFNGALTYRSLAFYCRRFGIPSDDTINGADIAGLVIAQDWEAIESHVRADVAKTAALAKKLGYLN